ncbi:hypothetical protein L0F63_001599, partial [Massospora cicadina]
MAKRRKPTSTNKAARNVVPKLEITPKPSPSTVIILSDTSSPNDEAAFVPAPIFTSTESKRLDTGVNQEGVEPEIKHVKPDDASLGADVYNRSASTLDGLEIETRAVPLDKLSNKDRRHYTLEIFDEWLLTVQTLESHLLKNEEVEWIAKYYQLAVVWLRVASLVSYFPSHPESEGPLPADMLEAALTELVDAGFLNDSLKDVMTLEEMIEVISLEELRQLCSKEAWAKNVRSVTRRANYVRRGQEILGRMVRIDAACFSCFELVQVIYLREVPLEGRAMASAIRVRIGNIRYPNYNITRSAEVFRNRAQLDRFIRAAGVLAQVHDILLDHTNPERFTTVWRISEDCIPAWQLEIDAAQSFTGCYFLLRYTAGWLYTKLVEIGAAALARQKLYVQEVAILESLLAQHAFRRGKRGDWYVRLALVQHTHFADRRQGGLAALATCLRGIHDPYVSPSCLNELITRLGRLKRMKFKDSSLVSLAGPELCIPNLTRYHLRELPETVLEGERTRSSYIEAGTRHIYRAQDGAEITVEALALDYYQRKGYMGYH